MSFDEGAAALAPVQRKAVQRAPGVGGASAPTSQVASVPAPAPAPAAAPGGGGGGGGAAPQAQGGPVTIDAPSISLNAPMVTASGVMKVGTLIADNVVGTNYTPGAGNVM